MISRQERDKNGNLKYYINIVTGQYFTCDPENPNKITLFTRQTISSNGKEENCFEINEKTRNIIRQIIQHVNIDRYTSVKEYDTFIRGNYENIYHSHQYNPVYEEHFLKQIIKYQQLLLYCRSRVSYSYQDIM